MGCLESLSKWILAKYVVHALPDSEFEAIGSKLYGLEGQRNVLLGGKSVGSSRDLSQTRSLPGANSAKKGPVSSPLPYGDT